MTPKVVVPRIEYLDAINKIPVAFQSYAIRQELVRKYSWAIPNKAALIELAKLSPIVEIGAGTGYLAYLLRKMGVDMLAVDEHPADSRRKANRYHSFTKAWTKIEVGGVEKVKEYPDRNLLLCWPPYDEPMAVNCLRAYKGKVLAYIGEGLGGCTADNQFHDLLEDDFECVERIDIPQWDGLHDFLSIWKRK